MSRVADNPIALPKGVELKVSGSEVSVKGSKGSLTTHLPVQIKLTQEENVVSFVYNKHDKEANKLAGTARANVNNMVVGVSEGFERKLTLIGVGYRAQAQGEKLNLTLGFSHPVDFSIPEGITVETPSQTEILVKGIDKQLVGQVAANIREFRPPEPYKGKGVRYVNEYVVRKEAKKK
jgi:large subunit ribosomal protein L6